MAHAAPLQKKPAETAKPRRQRGGGGGPRAPATTFGVPLQRKMTVGPSRDSFEAQADRAASHVVGGGSGHPAITPLGAGPAQRAMDEEETAQRKTKAPEEELQRKSKVPEDELQRKAAMPDEELQRAPSGTGPGAAPASVETGIRSARGGGSPLPDATRSRMETGFGRDFGAVRVHDDSRADRMNSAINARAFTSGSDIFFSRGSYDPGSRPGQTLLAHELTHVAQQTSPGSVRTSALQREENVPETSTREDEEQPKPRIWKPSPKSARSINLDAEGGPLFRLPELVVPRYGKTTKGVNPTGTIKGGTVDGAAFLPSSAFLWNRKGRRQVTEAQDLEDNSENATQVQIWETYVKANSGIADKLKEKFDKSKDVYTRGTDGPRVYYLQHRAKDARVFTLVGTAEEIAANAAMLRPPFGPDGSDKEFMQVDHFIEIQLGGLHSIDNMWLLEADANQKSGRDIKNSVVEDLNSLVSDADKDKFWDDTNPAKPGPFKSWPDGWRIEFARVKGQAATGSNWDKSDIAGGKQVGRLAELTPHQMKAAGLGLKPGDQPAGLTIFLSKDSAYRRVMKVKDDKLLFHGREKTDKFVTGFNVTSTLFNKLDAASMKDGVEIGRLTGTAFGDRKIKGSDGEKKKLIEVPDFPIPILLRTQYGYESHINRGAISKAVTGKAAKLNGASPISFSEAGLTENWELLARGTITADNPLFPGLTFGLTLQGNAILLDVMIPLDYLKLGPFEPTEVNLRLGVDDRGLVYAGSAAFILRGVGSGTIEADRDKLAGKFGFDIDAFDPAEIGVTYANGAWSAEGWLGIKKGTIPFVQSADVEVRVDENGFFMSGTATLGGPGIPAGTVLDVLYNQDTGELKFGADIPFDTARIPGLSAARAALTLRRGPEGTWSVAGAGSVSLSLPYVTGSGTLAYEDGYLDASAFAKISRPPMTGTGTVQISNRPADESGQPIEGPPLDTFRIWGGGIASVTFGNYITGTVGISFLENGEIELVGEVALPDEIELIKPRKWPYKILDIPEVRVPILGLTVPVVRKSFGVFAYIGGGVDAEVTLGPGVLKDSKVGVDFNPDRPEDTTIVGTTSFEMRAGAEIGLTVKGGIGASIGIVEATGDVGLRGGLGLELIGGGAVQVAWTPADGLSVDATVAGEAKPKFTLKLIAGARVKADLWVWSGTIWSDEWSHTLAEIGPDIAWKATLPASWSEKDGLDVDINNLVITKPNLDLIALGKEVFDAAT
jgi:hypothetical protein